MKKFSLVMLCALASTQTFAMFCPKNFNQINIGDTLEKVTQTCGAADSTKTYKVEPGKAQEWKYFVKPDPKQPSSITMSVAFDADKKVVNITVNGTTLMTTTICGSPISVGDSADSIKGACGSPAFTNQGNPPDNTPPPTTNENTELTYATSPPVVLVFENGILKERK